VPVYQTRAVMSSASPSINQTQSLPEPFYSYGKLQPGCIRLLVLLPAPINDPIRCILRLGNLVSFDDINGRGGIYGLRSYEAVSYVWSGSTPEVEISCDGARLCITRSLGDVLRRFRYVDRERVLWADGACINQADEEERTQQVQLMGLIYWKAQACLVWLGFDDEIEERWRASQAVDLLNKLSRLHRRHETVSADAPDEHQSTHGVFDTKHNSWEALRRLLERKWFSRVWILQEFGLAEAATFFCGAVSFDAHQLRDTLSLLRAEDSALPRFHDLDLRMVKLGYSYIESTRGPYRLALGNDPSRAESFLDILELARGSCCTDPRDMVYAFLGHPSAFKQQLLDATPYVLYPRNFFNQRATIIEPDYDPATTVEEVFLRLAYAALNEQGLGLDLLYHVSHNEYSIQEDFPSWVPRWTMDETSCIPRFARSRFSAGTGMSTEPLLLDLLCPELLRIKALPLGQVIFARELPSAYHFAISPAKDLAWSDTQPVDYSNPIEELCIALVGLTRLSSVDSHLRNQASLACTLTMGRQLLHSSADSDTMHHLLCDFDAYRRTASRGRGEEVPDEIRIPGRCAAEDQEGAKRYLQDMKNLAPRKTLFATRDGRLGLGPRITIEEDELWLFKGASMPFVLRADGDKRFKVIGLAYLHGVMRGEAVAGLNEGDFEDIVLI
jgi:hypothetical protein